MDRDLQIRMRAFGWLAEKVSLLGDVLPREVLREGFEFEGERVPLVSPQGIFKPRIMEFPLSITTSPDGPYDDNSSPDGLLRYRYRGNDPNHRDNRGLRAVYELRRPLVYLLGLVPGRYLAVWPVYVVGDDTAALTFRVAVDDASELSIEPAVGEGTEARRAYITAAVRQRLHQRGFRERVLDAYRSSCAFCRLRHRELLDAAHIVPDNEAGGHPVVNNGLALCKLHHAAFDAFILAVTPDRVIQVRRDVLVEEDGPLLQHGLKDLHERPLVLPASRAAWPAEEFLDWRYQRFQQAGSGGG